MKQELSKEEIIEWLKRLKESMPLEERVSCECFQGFIAQLEMDASFDIAELIEPLQVEDSELHRCLGCDPCSPADIYTEYLQNKN